MYKEDLALHNLKWLICHESQPKLTKPKIFHCQLNPLAF